MTRCARRLLETGVLAALVAAVLAGPLALPFGFALGVILEAWAVPW